jgi:putative transposase
MGRPIRRKSPGAHVHIWQRGNHQESVFLSPADNREFLRLLRRSAERFEMRIMGYCLMRNHYHVIASGGRLDSVEKAIGQASHDYSLYMHRRREQTGHLWQGRYGSVLLTESHFWTALCYVERNPVEAGLVQAAWDWPWSSARAHLGMDNVQFLDTAKWGERYRAETWRGALEQGIYESSMIERLEEAVRTGRTIEGEDFREVARRALAGI